MKGFIYVVDEFIAVDHIKAIGHIKNLYHPNTLQSYVGPEGSPGWGTQIDLGHRSVPWVGEHPSDVARLVQGAKDDMMKRENGRTL